MASGRANGDGSLYQRTDGKWEVQFATNEYYASESAKNGPPPTTLRKRPIRL